jgi:hypothetical protein
MAFGPVTATGTHETMITKRVDDVIAERAMELRTEYRSPKLSLEHNFEELRVDVRAE